MIVWLASYPRSGNTLTRRILRRCFKVETHSIYDEGGTNLVHNMGLAAFSEMARASDDTYFVKTHELPSANNDPEKYESDRTIYIARDGRAAMSSHRAYLQDVSQLTLPIEYIALGAPPLVGWSDHVMAWLARPADKQLVLYYEELSTPNREVLEGLSAFIGRPLLREFDVTFAELHAKNPVYFRVGYNKPGIEEVERMCPEIFWGVNGAAMIRLGYGTPETDLTPLSDPQLGEIRQAMMHTRTLASRQAPESSASPS